MGIPAGLWMRGQYKPPCFAKLNCETRTHGNCRSIQAEEITNGKAKHTA